MKISYNWLKDYLPMESIDEENKNKPEKMGNILTSVGLEVENIINTGSNKNNLDGLIVGEIISVEKHPNADKLKITTVDNGQGETLQIVCGAANVTKGQKVVIAPVGVVIHPVNREPFQIKKATIRGVESFGMLCAEDEIGAGNSHEGIIVLPPVAKTGAAANEYFESSGDAVFEIGLTPNRMDAMSHLGVAKDVCAYLSHHKNKVIKVISPFTRNFLPDNHHQKINVVIENTEACSRYAGVSISNIKILPSPQWLQNKLKNIGVRSINNIVDITNFILHETGQPLHAFDAGKIKGNTIIVKKLPEGTSFITLDEKTRKLSNEDVMICNGDEEPMCFGGVFGGLESGVTANTTDIFLESAWFDPASIRRTSLRHNLRTDAAIRFEKGVDISNTVNVLKRAALLIKGICGGEISSGIVDVYPFPKVQNEVTLQRNYLKKISGKTYDNTSVKNILESLNFTIVEEAANELKVAVPFSNPDITKPADIVEEIMRIDGLDNIEIPSVIKIAPSAESDIHNATLKEKIAGWLTGNGFSEIFTNSITNSKYYNEQTLATTVRIINSLSEDLNVMRPSMMQSGLESIAYNINRKNPNLLFFEFGKTYAVIEKGKYNEQENLAIFFTGNKKDLSWKTPAEKVNIYFVNGLCNTLLSIAGLKNFQFSPEEKINLDESSVVKSNGINLAQTGSINKVALEKFSIKQPVFYINIYWQNIAALAKNNIVTFTEIPKFPQVQRDLSIVVNKEVPFQSLENAVNSLHLKKLTSITLFDVFENEKLGANKKSFAISLTFLDTEKTMTDEETDTIMAQIIHVIETNLEAEIRRNI